MKIIKLMSSFSIKTKCDECDNYKNQIEEGMNQLKECDGSIPLAKKMIIIGYNYIVHNQEKKCKDNFQRFESTLFNKLREFSINKKMKEFCKTYLDLLEKINIRAKECLFCEKDTTFYDTKICNDHVFNFDLKVQILDPPKCYQCKKYKKCDIHIILPELKRDICSMKKNICQHHIGCEIGTYLKKSYWHCDKHIPMNFLKQEVNKYICKDVSDIIINYYDNTDDFDEFKEYYQMEYCKYGCEYEYYSDDDDDGNSSSEKYCNGHIDYTVTKDEVLLGYYISYGNWIMAEYILKSKSIRDSYKQRAILCAINVKFKSFTMAKYFLEQKEMKDLHVCGDILYDAEQNYNEEFFNYLMNRKMKKHYPDFDIEIKLSKKKENEEK